jgi:hypothetical protein
MSIQQKDGTVNGTVIVSGEEELAETTDDSLSPEERQSYAWMDEETQSLISPEDRLDPDVVPVKREASRSPITRTIFVLVSLGVFVLFGLFISIIAGFGRSRQSQVTTDPTPSGDEFISPSEADYYRGRLALTDQQTDQVTSADDDPTPTPQPSPSPTPRSTAPRADTAALPPPPAPRAQTPPPAPRPAPTPLRSQPSNNGSSAPPVDPFDRWNQLAALSSATADVETETATPLSEERTPQDSLAAFGGGTLTDYSLRTGTFPAAVIGSDTFQSSSEAIAVDSNRGVSERASELELSSGARGILEGRQIGIAGAGANVPQEVSQDVGSFVVARSVPESYQVALGSSAAAEVSVPMYWESGSNESNRFAVTLTEPLIATNGDVALPTGTIFITEAQLSDSSSRNSSSRIVSQTVVAVVYESIDGTIHQEPVQPGTIMVRGRNNEPLIAERRQRSNLGNDFLMGLTGGLGRVGQVLSENDFFTTTSSSGNDRFSSTVTQQRRSGDSNVLAAALDGFFNPLLEQMQQRAESREQRQEPNIFVVGEGREVSVFVNGLLEVRP